MGIDVLTRSLDTVRTLLSSPSLPTPRLAPFVRQMLSYRGRARNLSLPPDDGVRILATLSEDLCLRGIALPRVAVLPPSAEPIRLDCSGRVDLLLVRFLPGGFFPTGHGGLRVVSSAPMPLESISAELSQALERELGPTLDDSERAQVAGAVLHRAVRLLRTCR